MTILATGSKYWGPRIEARLGMTRPFAGSCLQTELELRGYFFGPCFRQTWSDGAQDFRIEVWSVDRRVDGRLRVLYRAYK